jgi:cobalt-zinc-cadmium efflux system outer membrane protein
MRKLACAVCSLAAAVAWSSSARGEDIDVLTLERALALAKEHNPEISVLRTEIDAAKASLEGESRLIRENPTVEGEIGPRLVPGQTTRLEYGAALTQFFEIAGQRGARVDAAEAALRSTGAQVEARERALIAEVRIAFTRALAARSTAAIAREAEALAKSALDAAIERERLGDASRVEVNVARIELGRAVRERLALEREEASARGMLALLVGLPDPDLDLAGELKSAATSTVPSVEDALATAKRERPELRLATAEVEAAEAEAKVAFREAFPDVSIGALYEKEESAHVVRGTLGFELPLFDRNQTERGVTEARVLRSRRIGRAAELAVEREVRLALARYTSARSAAETYAQEVLEAIRENLELATEAYRAGKLDFLELVIVRRDTVAAQRGHIEALETLNAAEAELDRALGRTR